MPEGAREGSDLKLPGHRLPPTGEEAGHVSGRLFRRKEGLEEIGLLRQPLCQGPLCGIHGCLRSRDGRRGKARDAPGKAVHEGANLIGWQGPIEIAPGLRRFRIEIIAP